MLDTAPSLSIYTEKDTVDEVEDKEKRLEEESSNLIRSITIGDKIDDESADFTFVKPNDGNPYHMDLISEEAAANDDVQLLGGPPLYLRLELKDEFREEKGKEESEDYYRELLQEYPNHSLVLKYYAQYLKRKGHLEGAEDYYFRAAKADPSDGEVLSQYALLIWELHRDQERASTYFQLAAQATPKDSTVLAAYAKFLWEIDDDKGYNSFHLDHAQQKTVHLHSTEGNLNSAVTIDGLISQGEDLKNGVDIEKYYRRMAEENLSDPLHLKKYSQYLFQSKGDFEGAEELYSRAILLKPQDGEILSQYATLLWELYHDQKRSLSYMERAIEAAPEDSNILAAYARFLWTLDDDEF